MAARSNAELLEIVTDKREEYNEEALMAADLELKNRNLSEGEVKRAEETVAENTISELMLKEEGLKTGEKLLFFIFFAGIIPWVIAHRYKQDGFVQKHRDAVKCMSLGIATAAGFIVLLVIVVHIASIINF